MQAGFLKDKSNYTGRLLHSDIEAKGFLDTVNKPEDVWCLVSRDDETDEVFLFHDYPEYDNKEVFDQGETHIIPPRTGTLLDGVRFWYLAGKNGSKLSVHNCFTYDKPLVEKIWAKCEIPDEAWVDTFIQSKIQYFDRPQRKGAKSPHGLLNYSLMEGNKKPEVEDFSIMNAFMLHRCIIDTKTQKFAYNYLKKEREMLKSKLGIDMEDAYKVEVEYTKNCHEQEMVGVLADKPHMEACISLWDEKAEEIQKAIEPVLPPTIKVSGGKVSRVEMAALFGYDTSGMKDAMEMVKKDGEMVSQPVKPYYKPTTNFHTVKKVNQYSGFNISYGYSPKFTKKNDLTKWIKSQHPKGDTAKAKELSEFVKEWEIEKNIEETKLLNKNTCDYFEVEPEDTDIIAGAHTKIKFTPSKLTQHEIVKGFLIKNGLKGVSEWNFKKDSDGSFIKADKELLVSYPPKATKENQLHYKVKKGDIIVSSPKVSEKDYEGLENEDAKRIGEYNTTVHRRRFLSNEKDPSNKGLMAYIREDGRIPCGINNFSTSSGRGSHRKWVNAAGEGSLYGEEIRKCLIAPEGRRLVGADMASAQLAILSFYARNAEYYEAVASGLELEKDDNGVEKYVGMSAHCHSARNFGMVSKEEFEKAVETQDPDLIHSISLRRKKSKGASFGVCFGCSGKKLAGLLGVPESEGNAKKDMFLSRMGLQGIIDWGDKYKDQFKRGKGFYLPLPFGYWAWCDSTHKICNFLAQGAEAACQKIAVNYFNREVVKRGLDAFKVLDYHDEFLVEASDQDAEEAGKLMCESYKYASDKCFEWYKENPNKFPNIHGGVLFAFNLDGGYKVSELGNKGNYLQTH